MNIKEKVQEYQNKHPVNCPWPSVISDHEALLFLIEKYNVKMLFEFGTWQGHTTQMMAECSNVEKIYTLDVHNNLDISYTHASHGLSPIENYGKFITSKKVEQIFHDSMTYKPNKEVDMVFVDANHDYTHVKNDTELALKMNPKVIAWHDYHSPGNPGVEQYIDELIKNGYDIKVYPNSIVAYVDVINGVMVIK